VFVWLGYVFNFISGAYVLVALRQVRISTYT
jgi:hypothetical protein